MIKALVICELVMLPLIANSTLEPLFVCACMVEEFGLGDGEGVEATGVGVGVEIGV